MWISKFRPFAPLYLLIVLLAVACGEGEGGLVSGSDVDDEASVVSSQVEPISATLINTPPSAEGGSETVSEDVFQHTLTLPWADIDEGDVAELCEITQAPENGELGDCDCSDGVCSIPYTPKINFQGSDSFQYIVNDGVDSSLSASFELTIEGGAFVSTWKTDNPGTSNDDQITLPLVNGGSYNFVVNWGDNSSDVIENWNATEKTHTYSIAGTYEVSISGEIIGWEFYPAGDEEKILDINNWGGVKVGNGGNYFRNARNLTISATDIPDLSETYTMAAMFYNCESLSSVPNMNRWDTSEITNMGLLFYGASLFNEGIGSWEMGSVTSTYGMFHSAASFDSEINSWDVSNVTDMSYMFVHAYSFDQPLWAWDTSAVEDMAHMFHFASVFNGDIGPWDTSSIQNMSYMFSRADEFDQDIGGWDMSNVTNTTNILSNSGMGTESYDSTLIGWSLQTLQAGNTPKSTDLTYSPGVASSARALIEAQGWTITDDNVDTSYPTLGAFSATAGLTSTSFELNWNAGTDIVTAPNELEYYVCSAADPHLINTVAKCLGATREMDWSANILTSSISGKVSGETYHYNVVLRDSDGNRVIYEGISVTTP